MRSFWQIALVSPLLTLSANAYAQTIEWTAGQIGGGWYTVAAGITDILNKSGAGLTVKVVPGGGAANPTKVENGISQIGNSIDVFAKMAAEGTRIYEGKPKHEKLRMIGQSLGDTPFHFVRGEGETLDFTTMVKEGKDIRIGLIEAGGTDVLILEWMINDLGESFESLKARGWTIVRGDYSVLAEAFKDGRIDYVIFAAGEPSSAIQDMMTSRRGELVPFSHAEIAMAATYGLSGGSLAAGTYPAYQNDSIKTFKMATTLITSSDVSEDVVYRITKVICENQERLPNIQASLRVYDCKTAAQVRPVPLHPGALKYYREQSYLSE